MTTIQDYCGCDDGNCQTCYPNGRGRKTYGPLDSPRRMTAAQMDWAIKKGFARDADGAPFTFESDGRYVRTSAGLWAWEPQTRDYYLAEPA